MKSALYLTALLLAAAPAAAQPAALDTAEQAAPALPTILPLRERARVEDALTKERLETVVPKLMREHGVDMWILLAREYAEDPVVLTMLDAENFHARRQTILVFHDPGAGKPVERLTVSRYGLGGLFAPAWEPEKQPDQWARLAEIVAARDPKRIAVNTSELSALADGLTHSQHTSLMRALPPAYAGRVVPAETLAIGWLELRTPAEMARYRDVVRTTHAIIAQGFSAGHVKPGVTTADDLVWWFRERIAGLKLGTWFQPSVDIFRAGEAKPLSGDAVIQPGDMLWVDIGVTYLGLNSDVQHLAYVLKPGETDAPAGLKAGLAAANAAQDALTSSFKTGLSGNEMLAAALLKAKAAGVDASIYSHPIGFHGHAAGAAIGFWDNQAPSPKGSYRLRPDTAWSIELKVSAPVPEWSGQQIDFRLEEDAFWDGQAVRYIDGRMSRFHLIGGADR